ncbi:MAG: hypothetical protein ACLTK0_07650 [Anaerovoracaceae bacterium]
MTPDNVFLIDIRLAGRVSGRTDEAEMFRIPVCRGDNDNIIGILHIKDYLIRQREQLRGCGYRAILKPTLCPAQEYRFSLL